MELEIPEVVVVLALGILLGLVIAAALLLRFDVFFVAAAQLGGKTAPIGLLSVTLFLVALAIALFASVAIRRVLDRSRTDPVGQGAV